MLWHYAWPLGEPSKVPFAFRTRQPIIRNKPQALPLKRTLRSFAQKLSDMSWMDVCSGGGAWNIPVALQYHNQWHVHKARTILKPAFNWRTHKQLSEQAKDLNIGRTLTNMLASQLPPCLSSLRTLYFHWHWEKKRGRGGLTTQQKAKLSFSALWVMAD